MDYGSKRPNIHTMPLEYYSKSSAFTEVLVLKIKFIFYYIILFLSIWERLVCLEIIA